MTPTKVVITGGSGFLGCNFIEAFLEEEGASIYTTYYKNPQRLEKFFGLTSASGRNSDVLIDQDERIRAYQLDLSNPEMSDKADLIFGDADILIHCAAFTGGADVVVNKAAEITHRNARMDLSVFHYALRYSIPKVVYISSTAIYEAGDKDFREAEGFIGDPDPVFFGIGWMKRFGEKMAYSLPSDTTTSLVLRPSNMYGPYDHFSDKGHVVSGMMYRMSSSKENEFVVWGTDDVVRDLIFVKDVTRYTKKLLNTEHVTHTTYNVCTGVSTTMGNLAKTMKKVVGYGGNISFDTSKPVTKKIQRVSPANMFMATRQFDIVNLPLGLDNTYRWYCENKGE